MNILRDYYYLHDDVPKNYTGIVEYYNGDKEWFLNGQRHRTEGPASERINGKKEWCLEGINYSQEEWFDRLSDEDKLKAIWNL
jgi:hypothetical protein